MSASLRAMMGCYPTGVTIVAACDDEGAPYGLTVNSFTSVSLDPPLVSVCIGHKSLSHDRLASTPHFTINLLAGGQDHLARRFAREPSEGRFDGVSWAPSVSGHPVIEGVVGWLDCSIHQILTVGDHSILVAQVEDLDSGDLPSLVFHRGQMISTGP